MRLDLDSLAAASREALTSEWREVVGRPPQKHLSKTLMVKILSHAYQMDAVGGYTKRLSTTRTSDQFFAAKAKGQKAEKPLWN